MLLLEDVHQFCVENLQKCIVNSSGMEWTARCPFCGDSQKSKFKKRFHLKFESDESVFYHCFNCNESGTFFKLYAHVKGISEEDAYREFRKFDSNQLKKKFTQTLTQLVKKKSEPKFLDWILEDCIKTPSNSKETRLYNAWKQWEQERKISGTFVAYKGKWANRVIIPVYEAGHIIYFQGRTLIGAEPKYLNPITEKSNVILNKERFNPEKFIIVTEGLLDAMSINDHQGTSCLGSSISDSYITELYKYTRKGIVIALDNDETGKKQIKKLLKESKFANQLKYFIMPDLYKDLNEVKMKNDNIDLYEYVMQNTYDYFKLNVLLRLPK